jgi:hypothetical protein
VRERGGGVMKCGGQIFVSPILDVNKAEGRPARSIDVLPVSVLVDFILEVTISDKGRVITGTTERCNIAF